MTAQATIAPFPKHTFFDNNGFVAVGHQLFVYLAGSTTKTTTWSDAGMLSANTNPIILDSAGRCNLFILPGTTLKFVLAPPTDTDPPASPIWTIDGVAAVPPGSSSADTDVQGVAGSNLSAGDAVYLSEGSGGKTSGRWYQTDAGSTYSSSEAQAVGFVTTALTTGTTGTIRRSGRVTGLTGLVAGAFQYASAAPGGLTSTAPTNARLIAQADTTTSVIIIPGSADASATVGGQVNIGPQTLAGIKTLAAKLILSSAGAQFASGSILQNLIWARSTANFTKNANVTLSNVTDLAFAVEASASYLFLFLLYGVSTTVADFKFTLTGPAAPTALRFGTFTETTTGAASASAFGTAIFNAGIAADEGLIIHGLLRNGTNAGTVQLQAAQATSEATNTVIYAESVVLALKLS